jgi:hypothetical protein
LLCAATAAAIAALTTLLAVREPSLETPGATALPTA